MSPDAIGTGRSGDERRQDPFWADFVLVAITAVMVEIVRSESVGQPWIYVVESLVSLALPVWLTAKGRRARASGGGRASSDPAPEPAAVTGLDGERYQSVLLLGLLFLPLVLELVLRWGFSIGQAPELVLMSAIRNLALLLVGYERRGRNRPLAGVLSLFLLLGALAQTERLEVYGLAILYGVGGIWWLIGSSWERLRGRFAAQSVREVPRSFKIAIGSLSLAVLALIGLGVSGVRTTTALSGWMYSSGGDRWNDTFAAGGINDGEQLVGGVENADSFGPVETNLFLESKQSSLYDVASDLYGEAIKKVQQEKAIALGSDVTSLPNHERKAQSNKAGREFSTVRRPSRKKRKLEDVRTDALVYVAGRVPLHLRLETFNRYDGREWTHSDLPEPQPDLNLKWTRQKPWVAIRWRDVHPALGPAEHHALKVVRLGSPRIPTPMYPTGVHIDRVDRTDFFGWTADSVLEMPGRDVIPSLQVIHWESRALRLDDAPYRAGAIPPAIAAKYGELPGLVDEAFRRRLVKEWTQGHEPGWAQVQAVIARLRETYVLDSEVRVPEGCDDAVGWFLRESRAGPDYLFASSAAVLLRSMGYSTRLVTGLYARPERYDRVGRHTPVLPSDVHVWLEVAVDHLTWQTLEPTPGYEVLGPPLGWWEQGLAALAVVGNWAWRNPAWVGLGLAVGIGLIVLWRWWLAGLCFVVWWVWCRGPAGRRVAVTLWLLEKRARLANCPRPPGVTVAKFYGRIARSNTGLAEVLVPFVEVVGIWLYSPHATAGGRPEWNEICHRVGWRCTTRRLRDSGMPVAAAAGAAPAMGEPRVARTSGAANRVRWPGANHSSLVMDTRP